MIDSRCFSFTGYSAVNHWRSTTIINNIDQILTKTLWEPHRWVHMSTSFHLALKNLQHFLIILRVSAFVIFQIHKLQNTCINNFFGLENRRNHRCRKYPLFSPSSEEWLAHLRSSFLYCAFITLWVFVKCSSIMSLMSNSCVRVCTCHWLVPRG